MPVLSFLVSAFLCWAIEGWKLLRRHYTYIQWSPGQRNQITSWEELELRMDSRQPNKWFENCGIVLQKLEVYPKEITSRKKRRVWEKGIIKCITSRWQNFRGNEDDRKEIEKKEADCGANISFIRLDSAKGLKEERRRKAKYRRYSTLKCWYKVCHKKGKKKRKHQNPNAHHGDGKKQSSPKWPMYLNAKKLL